MGILSPRTWELWQLPRRMVAYVLGIEVLTALAVVLISMNAHAPTSAQWMMAAVLLGCASAHAYLSRIDEEKRRSADPGPHIDVTGVWTLPAALVLPLPLAVALTLVLRGLRYRIAHRAPYRFVFSTNNIVLANVVAHTLAKAAGLTFGPAGVLDALWQAVVAAAAVLLCWAVQLLAVGGVIALSVPNATRQDLYGSADHNLLELMTFGIGVLVAAGLVRMPLVVVAVLPVTVILNRWQTLKEEVRRLEAESMHDWLTGLLTRRGWEEQAPRALGRAGDRCALLMLDLDHFRDKNTRYGHTGGDAVLRAVGEVLRKHIRPGDVAGKYGGEELVVLLPGATLRTATGIAERIRRAIQGLEVTVTDPCGGHLIKVEDCTVSIGVGSSPQHGSTVDTLVKTTDQALYLAKNTGRNRVCTVDDLDSRELDPTA